MCSFQWFFLHFWPNRNLTKKIEIIQNLFLQCTAVGWDFGRKGETSRFREEKWLWKSRCIKIISMLANFEYQKSDRRNKIIDFSIEETYSSIELSNLNARWKNSRCLQWRTNSFNTEVYDSHFCFCHYWHVKMKTQKKERSFFWEDIKSSSKKLIRTFASRVKQVALRENKNFKNDILYCCHHLSVTSKY